MQSGSISKPWMYNKRVLYSLQPHNGRKKGARRQALGVFCKTYLTKALFFAPFFAYCVAFSGEILDFFLFKRYHKDRIKIISVLAPNQKQHNEVYVAPPGLLNI